MVVKRAAQINHADDRFRRDARGASQGVEQHGMFVAVAFSGLQDFERIRDADRRLLGDFFVDPVFDSKRGPETIGFALDDFRAERADAGVVGLHKRRRLQIGR